MSEVLHIECADGQVMPYLGYICTSITPYGMPIDSLHGCSFLVVPTSQYNSRVPLLIGTNIISRLIDVTREEFGSRFLQDADLHTSWYLAFRCMTLRERELRRNGHRLGIVKSAETERITIPPNGSVRIRGYLDRKLPYHQVLAMLQATTKSSIPSDLDVTPSLHHYNYTDNSSIPVEISNVTTRTVSVSPRAILCELQPVTILDTVLPESAISPDVQLVLDKVKISKEITTREQQRCRELITEFSDIFSKGDTDVGTTDRVKHRIDLEDTTPFKQRYRRIPPSVIEEVRTHLQELLASGVIRPSHSPFSSNVVLVRKHDGALRLCVDYRQLNSRTIKDNYALPRIDDILDSLSGNKYFTVLDMKSGYHQIEIEEQHKERTAFTVGPLGFFEFNKMSFGLANAPATYQRLQEQCLGDLHLKICFIYLDDLIIFSRTFDEHITRLRQVFSRIQDYGLKLSPKKCSFLMKQVKYIGHIVSEQGVQADPDKIDKVTNWPTPTNPDQVRSFLGFVGYYRKFIQNFSKIARPLIDVMATGKKSRGKQQQSTKWKWGKEQTAAFEALKDKLTTPPILGYPDFSLPFELHTDACGTGLGAVLYQKQHGHNRVIAYASRGLSRSEKNYPTHKLEFLALKWAITEKFSDYLMGQTFSVYTDNNPLTYILTSAKLDATGHRWVAALSAYQFSITYKPGKTNTDADALSRLPQTLSVDTVKAICDSDQGHPLIESLPVQPSTCCFAGCTVSSLDQTPDHLDLHGIQQKDPMISKWAESVKSGLRPKKDSLTKDDDKVMYRNFSKFRIKDDLLIKVIHSDDGSEQHQVVVPKEVTPIILQHLHNNMGHPGRDRTTSLVIDRFYWPRMRRDIATWIEECDRCLKFKTPDNQRAELVSIRTSYPLELVCMDYLTLEPCKGGIQNVLVITDHFSKFSVAVPTRNQTSKTTADALFHNFIVPYGIPTTLHSDQGANFSSKLIQDLCFLTGISKSRTTPYHPMGNGITERFNRTLISMLGTLEQDQKSDWKIHIGSLVHAYNATKHETTGFSPYFLMFGREPTLPVDLVFGLAKHDKAKTLSKYIENLQVRLEHAYEAAKTASKNIQHRQKMYYDQKAKGVGLREGDRVLVKVVAFDGKHKIADRWEDTPYIVLQQPNTNVPVFKVKREDGEGRCKTLHRNLLLPIGSKLPSPTPPPRHRVQTKKSDLPSTQRKLSQVVDSQEESDDDDIYDGFIVHVGTGTTTAETRINHKEDAPDVSLSTDGVESEESKDDDQTMEEESKDEDLTIEEETEPYEDVADLDTESSETEPSEHSQSEEDPIVPEPAPRRSSRNAHQPKWMKDYVMSEQVTTTSSSPEWLRRAAYLKELMVSGMLSSDDKQVTTALVSIIAGK